MIPAQQLEPAPGYTIPGVGVPGVPSEQQATDTAVEYGWLIAVLIIGAAVIGFYRWLNRQINFKVVGAVGFIAFLAYLYGQAKA